MSDWRSIKTAPKDTPVLVFDPEGVVFAEGCTSREWPENPAHVFVAVWQSYKPGTYGAADGLMIGWIYNERKPWAYAESSQDYDWAQCNPTHWQPIPDPP